VRRLAQASLVLNALLLLTVAVLLMWSPAHDEARIGVTVAGLMLVVLAPSLSIVVAALWLQRSHRGSRRHSRSREPR